MYFGYARVSDDDQNLDLQLIALKRAGCKTTIKEKISGKSSVLPELDSLIKCLKKGDVLVCWHVDRLGRDARGLLNLEHDLSRRGIRLVSLMQHFDTKTARGIYEFQQACINAQYESARISERTIAGMQAARIRGKHLGRRKRFRGEQLQRVRFLASEEKIPLDKIAHRFHCAPVTVWRALQPEYTVTPAARNS